jgi:hypothetical protein
MPRIVMVVCIQRIYFYIFATAYKFNEVIFIFLLLPINLKKLFPYFCYCLQI